MNELAMVKDERARLLEVLRRLTAQEWAAPSLCAGWSVKDTVAHVAAMGEETPPRLLLGMHATVFSLRAMMRACEEEARRWPPDALLERLRLQIRRRDEALGLSGSWLTEVVIHGLDLTVPLGRSVPHTETSVVAAADFVHGSRGALTGRETSRGLRLEADDVEWAAGSGPKITGPLRALLLVMTGRLAGLDMVRGPGVATLSDRMERVASRRARVVG